MDTQDIEHGATALQMVAELRSLVKNGYGENHLWLATETNGLSRYACVFTRSMPGQMLELAPAPDPKTARITTVTDLLDHLQNSMVKQNFHLGMYVHDDNCEYIDGGFSWMPITFIELLGRDVVIHTHVTENDVEEFQNG